MYDITIIDGTLTGLFSSINLSNNCKVCIIDLNQEIGFPTNFPGLIENIDILDVFVKEKDKLYLQENKSLSANQNCNLHYYRMYRLNVLHYQFHYHQ